MQKKRMLTTLQLKTDAPDYPIGHTINLVSQVCVALLASFGIFYVVRENRLRAKGKRDHRLEGIDEVQQRELGYRHPNFRYIP